MDPGKHVHAQNRIPGIPPSQNRIDDVTSGCPVPRAAHACRTLPPFSRMPACTPARMHPRTHAHECPRRTKWICRCIGQIYNNIPNIEQKSSAPPTKLPQILVGVDPMNLKSVRPPAHPEFRLSDAVRPHLRPPCPPHPPRSARLSEFWRGKVV